MIGRMRIQWTRSEERTSLLGYSPSRVEGSYHVSTESVDFRNGGGFDGVGIISVTTGGEGVVDLSVDTSLSSIIEQESRGSGTVVVAYLLAARPVMILANPSDCHCSSTLERRALSCTSPSIGRIP